MSDQSENLRGSLMMIAAMAAFTANDTCMKVITETVPLFQAIVLRGSLTMLALAVLAPRLGGLRLRFSRGDAKALGWRTLGEVAGTVTFLLALRHMPLANLSAIMQSLPLAVTLGAALVFRQAFGWRRMAAILVGFVGVLLIVRPGTEGFDIWSVLGLASVGFVVLRDLATRALSPEVPSVAVAFLAALAVTTMGLIVMPFDGWTLPPPATFALTALAAVFLVMGYLFVVMATRVGDVGLVAPFRYTALVFALLLGWLVFDQFPDAMTLVGSAIVVATGIYAFQRERRLARRG